MMRPAVLMQVVGLVVAMVCSLAGCGDDAGIAVGAERGPCYDDGLCNPGLICLSDLCVRPPDDAAVADAAEAIDADTTDASIDAMPPVDPEPVFDSDIAPILAAHCNSCHETGAGGAPVFGSTYASYVAYTSANGRLAGCTLTQSLLFTKGAHDAAAAFTPAENDKVRAFLDLQALATPSCASTAGRLPSSGPYTLQAADYTTDLSILGAGLSNAMLSFTVQQDVGAVLITNLSIIAGPNGVTAIGPLIETCPGGVLTPDPLDSFGDLRFDVPPGQTVPVGNGTFSLPGASLGDTFAFRFAALLPLQGALAAPNDFGGACTQ